ncbi:hypothetical protein [Leclercia sp. UBA2479]
MSNTQIDAVFVGIGIPGLQKQENNADVLGNPRKRNRGVIVNRVR